MMAGLGRQSDDQSINIMQPDGNDPVQRATSAPIETLYRQHARQVLATLIRLLGEFELAEEALQEAFSAALQQWPESGIPDNPLGWLIRIGHRRGIDQIRRRQTSMRHKQQISLSAEPQTVDALADAQPQDIGDDQLRLLFICCHPALSLEARLALTLREMCGLTTEQVASALLQQPATVAQRIVRAKRKIREARIPYEVPDADSLPQRLPDVLRVIYLLFNEGYSASNGATIVDLNLVTTAIQLATELAQLLPQGEVFGLLALMYLHDARREARQDAAGELITLEAQDRQRWDQDSIKTGLQWLTQALSSTPTAPYTLQACIAAEHALASSAEATNWARIVLLYEALYKAQPTAVIALNHAVAVAMRDTPAEGLALLEVLGSEKAIQNYHLYHAACADLHRRAGNRPAALSAYRRALALTTQAPEQRYLSRRIAELTTN